MCYNLCLVLIFLTEKECRQLIPLTIRVGPNTGSYEYLVWPCDDPPVLAEHCGGRGGVPRPARRQNVAWHPLCFTLWRCLMESWRCAFCGLTLQAVTKAAAAAAYCRKNHEHYSILTCCMMECLRAGPYNGKTTLNC